MGEELGAQSGADDGRHENIDSAELPITNEQHEWLMGKIKEKVVSPSEPIVRSTGHHPAGWLRPVPHEPKESLLTKAETKYQLTDGTQVVCSYVGDNFSLSLTTREIYDPATVKVTWRQYDVGDEDAFDYDVSYRDATTDKPVHPVMESIDFARIDGANDLRDMADANKLTQGHFKEANDILDQLGPHNQVEAFSRLG